MRLYDKYEAYSPIYQGYLTNHCPMILTILELWGEDPKKIEEHCDRYIDQRGIYDLTNHHLPITKMEEDYIHLTSHYLHEFRQSNVKETVATFLTNHKDMYPSALFHGLIRLYYSLKSDNELFVAQSLAYFDLVAEDCSLEGQLISSLDFAKELERARLFFKEKYQVNTKTTSEQYHEIIMKARRENILFSVENGSVTKEEVLELLLKKYLESNDFFHLHLITGFHALIGLNGYNYQFQYTLKQFLLNMQVFFLFNSEKHPIKDEITYSKDECFNQKSFIHDPHDLKLFYSVLDLMNDFKNEKLLMIANRIIKRAKNCDYSTYEIVD